MADTEQVFRLTSDDMEILGWALRDGAVGGDPEGYTIRGVTNARFVHQLLTRSVAWLYGEEPPENSAAHALAVRLGEFIAGAPPDHTHAVRAGVTSTATHQHVDTVAAGPAELDPDELDRLGFREVSRAFDPDRETWSVVYEPEAQYVEDPDVVTQHVRVFAWEDPPGQDDHPALDVWFARLADGRWRLTQGPDVIILPSEAGVGFLAAVSFALGGAQA